MAIVGTAEVLVRVVSNGLSRNIANNVRNGFNSAGPALQQSGRAAGQQAGQAAAAGVNSTQPAMNRAGQNIGQRFASSFNASIGRVIRRNVTPTITNGLRTGIRNGMQGSNTGIIKSFNINSFLRAGRDLGKELHRGFNLGIGSARMGPAVRSALLLALPSVLSGAGSLGAAMASQLVSSIAASGPAIAGALGVVAAGVSTLLLNFGLLKAAFNSGAEGITEFWEVGKEIVEAMGKPLAEGFIGDFTNGFERIRDMMPQIQDLLFETGQAFGRIATAITDTVTRADTMTRIRGILETNKGFLDNFSLGIGGLTSSFIILFNAVKPFVDYIGQAIAKFGQWAEQTLLAKEASGELGTFMDNLLESFKQGLDTLVDFGVGLWNVFRAAAAGAGSIGEIAEKFRAWTENPENMARMESFFEKMHTLASALISLFGGLAAAAGRALEKMDPGPILAVFQILTDKIAPALADLWNQVQSGAGENLVKIFDNLGTMLEKIVASGTFETVAKFISDLLVKVSEFLASDFGSTIAGWLLPLGLFGGILTSIIGPITTIIGLFTGPFAAVIAVIAAVAAVFATIYAESEKFRGAINDLVSAVSGTFSEIWEKLAPKIGAVWEKLKELAEVIGDRLAPVIEFLTPIVQRVFNFIGDTIGNFLDYMGGFIDVLVGIFTGDWKKIWSGLQQVVSAAWKQVQNVFNFAKDMLSFAWDAITSIIYNAGQVIYGIVTSIFNGVWGFIQEIWGEITDFFGPILEGIADTIRNWGNNIQTWWEEFWPWLGQLLVDAWNAMLEFLNGILTGIADTIRNWGTNIQTWWDEFWAWVGQSLVTAWNSMMEFLNSILTTIADTIRNWGNNIQIWWDQFWNWIRDAVVTAWNAIYNFFNTVLTNIADAIRTFGNAIQTFLSERWEEVRSTASSIWNSIVGIASTAWNNVLSEIRRIVGIIVSWLSQRWDEIVETARMVWYNIKEAIVQPVIDAYNAVVTWVRKIQTAMSNIAADVAQSALTIPVNLGPGLPGSAEGGIFRPTPGGVATRIAEKTYAERVEPLDPSGLSVRDRAIINMLAGGTGGDGTTVVKVYIGQRELDAVVDTRVEKANKTLGQTMSNGRRI